MTPALACAKNVHHSLQWRNAIATRCVSINYPTNAESTQALKAKPGGDPDAVLGTW